MYSKRLILAPGAFLLISTALMMAQAAAPKPAAPIAPVGGGAKATKQDTVQALDAQLGTRRNQERDAFEVRMERNRLKLLNKERHASLKKDTDKLLILATELKEAVDKTTKDTLSLEVIRKTEEVEKLAKQVREKMKQF